MYKHKDIFEQEERCGMESLYNLDRIVNNSDYIDKNGNIIKAILRVYRFYLTSPTSVTVARTNQSKTEEEQFIDLCFDVNILIHYVNDYIKGLIKRCHDGIYDCKCDCTSSLMCG